MLSIRAILILSFLFVSSANAYLNGGKMMRHNECIGLPDGKDFSELIIETTGADAEEPWMALWLAAGAGYVSITKYLLENYKIPSDHLESALKRAEENGKFEAALVIAKNLLKRSQDHTASCWYCPKAE